MNSSVVVFFTPAMAGGRAAPGAAVVGVGVACRATASSTRRDMSRFSLLTPGGSSVIMAILAEELVVAGCLVVVVVVVLRFWCDCSGGVVVGSL